MNDATQWEYRVQEVVQPGMKSSALIKQLEESLNTKGLAAWELVSTFQPAPQQPICFVYKRRLGLLKESHKDTDN